MPVLESVEGAADDDWPASPPLQSLHREDRPDGKRLALLVGMAGRSHWSLSVELDPVKQIVTCDVACRLHDQAEPLTSTYRIAESSASASEWLELRSGPHRFQLRPEATDQHSCKLEMAEQRLVAIRCETTAGPLPRTVRWRFALCRIT